MASHPALAVRPWRPPEHLPAPPLPWSAALPHLLGHLAFGTPLPASWQLLAAPVVPTLAGLVGSPGASFDGAGGGGGSLGHHYLGGGGGGGGFSGLNGGGVLGKPNLHASNGGGDHVLMYGFAVGGAAGGGGGGDSLGSSVVGEPGSPAAHLHSRRLTNGSNGSPQRLFGSLGSGSASSTGASLPPAPARVLRKRITLSSDEVFRLGLHPGKNVVTFSFSSRLWGRQEVAAHAYMWNWNAKVVVSDVDGTITKSDVLGHLAPMVGKDWNHAGVAHLYNNIKDNGYQLMFLSSRAISQSKGTRRYLEKLTQDGETLTQGPVMLAPDPLSTALYREVVVRRPQEFKMRCLQTIRDLFPPDWNPFYAGFGNRDTDTVSYASVGVPPGRNFTINPRSEVVAETTRMNKQYTLGGMNELVDDMFPPVPTSGWIVSAAAVAARGVSSGGGAGGGDSGGGAALAAGLVESDAFADANYWRKEIPVLDDDDLP